MSVHNNGLGTLEDNEIFGHRGGVVIRTDGNPTLRRNKIRDNAQQGVWIYEGGQGVFEDNDLRGNAKGAWYIDAASLPNVKRTGNLE